jgi:cytosine/adenosine deaminase-related metal-dependent hydrolase
MTTCVFCAELLYTGTGTVLENHFVETDNAGKILGIEPNIRGRYRTMPGAICPGFVNTHCHLELTHMAGKLATGTGLIPFIYGVVIHRQEDIDRLPGDLKQLMDTWYKNGIVACGDISNTTDSFAVKNDARFSFYTFVELFDLFQPHNIQKESEKAHQVLAAAQSVGHPFNRAHVSPHAPYSVSPQLFEEIRSINGSHQDVTVSIHNQETPAENEFLETGTGRLLDFYNNIGLPLAHFKPTAKRAIHYATEHLDPNQRTLFVHNTTSGLEDIRAAQAWSSNTYWATCPNANLYIENRLPDYQAFRTTGARVCIGTDSLASNWQLSILDELKTIHRYQSALPFQETIIWATAHGAQALGMFDRLGSIEPNKQPGLVWLSTPQLTQETTCRRLI